MSVIRTSLYPRFPTSHTVLSTWIWFSLLLTHELALLCAFPKLISISWIQFTAWSLTWAHICSKNKLLFEQNKKSTFLRFHKHANSKVQKPPSQLRFSLPVNNSYDYKQRTLKHRNHKRDQNPPSADHTSWPFEPVKVNFCFLRGPPRWLTAAKNENVSWLLMRSSLSQEVTWPTATRILSRGKRRSPRARL